MSDAAVYIASIRTKKHETVKADKSAEHSCGNRLEIANAIDVESPANVIMVLGEVVEAGPEAVEKVQNYISALKPKATYGTGDVRNKVDQKKKIKKWMSGARTTETEKEVYQGIIDSLDNNVIIPQVLVDQFEEIDEKISKRNDKISALKSLSQSQKNIVESDSKGNQLDVVVVEKVFKITERTSFNMCAIEQRKMAEELHNKLFPEYPIIFMACHYDESKEHVHFMHSGKSDVTGKFDYPNAEAQAVQKYMKDKGLEFSGFGKSWGAYSTEEVIHHGEIWQDLNYEHSNNYIKKVGINDWQFKKLEGAEKDEIRNKIRKDPKAKKAISNREHNNGQLNKIKNEALKLEIDHIQKDLNSKKENLAKLEKQITIREKIYKGFKTEYIELIKSGKRFINKVFKGHKDVLPEAKKVAKIADDMNGKYLGASVQIDKQIDEWCEKSKNNDIKKQRNNRKSNNSLKPSPPRPSGM